MILFQERKTRQAGWNARSQLIGKCPTRERESSLWDLMLTQRLRTADGSLQTTGKSLEYVSG